MALPDIPESWFKLINLLWMIALSILGVLGYQKIGNVEAGQGVTHQKQDATSAQVAAVEVSQEKTKVIATNTAMKVGAKLNGEK